MISRVDSLDTPFRIFLREGIAYCPSQNRTCGFPAYGSSNQHQFPVPDVLGQVRFLHIVIPNPVVRFDFHASFLMSAIEHPITRVFNVFPEVLYHMEIATHAIVIAVSCYCKLDLPHGFSHRFCQPCPQPCFDFLFLRFQFLLAGPHTQAVFTASCLGIEEGKSQKVEILFCAFEPPNRKYACLLSITFIYRK